MVIFQQWTFLHQNLARNLKIIGPQSKNNFQRRYDDVIFPALFAGSCLKKKVLVDFCVLCVTFNFEYCLKRSVYAYPDLLQRQRLVEQFPEK